MTTEEWWIEYIRIKLRIQRFESSASTALMLVFVAVFVHFWPFLWSAVVIGQGLYFVYAFTMLVRTRWKNGAMK